MQGARDRKKKTNPYGVFLESDTEGLYTETKYIKIEKK